MSNRLFRDPIPPRASMRDVRHRVLHLISDLNQAGAEAVVASLAPGLDGDAFEILVCSRKGGALVPSLGRVPVIILPKRGTIDLAYLWRLCGVIRRRGIHLVHAHLFGNNLYGFAAAMLTGRKVILTLHGEDCMHTRRRARFYRIAARAGARIVAVSAPLHRRLVEELGIAPRRVTLVPNGIDTRRFARSRDRAALRESLGLPSSALVVGAVGNVKPIKGYEALIRAAASVCGELPSARFLVAGANYGHEAHQRDLEEVIGRLGLGDRFRFLGKREDVESLLPLFDVYVLPSRSEGTSIALLEAMASGRPIVATRVGGNPYIVEDERSALLVPPDDPAALAAALLRVLRDHALAARLGEAAKRTAEARFSRGSMLERYRALYGEVLGR